MFFSLAYANCWLLYRGMLINGNAGTGKELQIADYSDLLWLRITTRNRLP